ncbi:minor capsid protein [Streptococcus mitis]|mgnify:FL=1|uniref:minor capsid protein n=1 Tax=Streptococcus mitis TaxID=28037 RepID=UPI0021B757D5|nr:minor capsid protein [Streptococcus mitis]
MTTENKKKIDEYWTERALQQEQNAQIVADRYMAQIGQSLADYKHQLVSEIEKFYAKYAVDNKMTHAEAKQYLTDKERREFKNVTLERFREMALNPDTPTPLLDALGYRHRISRKEALLAEIERLTAELYGKPEGIHDKVTEALSDVYIKGKIHQAKNLAHFGIIEKPILGVDAVKHKMASNWSGKTFSTNVWGHDAAVYKSISDTINKGLTGGWSIDRMARALSERTGVAYHRADTLVRTETTFYNNLATLDTIKELGGDHYEIVAVLDSRTSEICRLENHEVHSVKEYEPGRTAPPFHVRCRSTIRPVVKSDKPSPYFNILQNDGSVKLATEQRSLDEIFAGWEREGEAVLRGVKESKPEVADKVFVADKPNEIDDFFKKQKSYQKWYNELTEEEKNAIYTYTGSDYHNFNNIKRFGIDKAFKLSEEFWLEEHGEADLDLALKRVREAKTKIPFLEKALSDFAPEKSFKAYRGTGSVSALGEDLGYMNLEVGQKLTLDKSFTSFSLDKNYAREFAIDGEGADILFEVTVRKGQKTGAYIAELSDFNPEKEYLMKPNLKYNVVSKKETEDGLLVYGLEVLENGS